MDSTDSFTNVKVRPGRSTTIIGALVLVFAVCFFTWKSGALTDSASTVPPKLTSQTAKQNCIDQFASTFPNDRRKITGIVTPRSVVVISETPLRAGWMVTLMNRPTHAGFFCLLGAGSGLLGPVASVPRDKPFAVEQFYIDHFGRTAQFGYVIRARSTISSVRAILATGVAVSARTRYGFATVVIEGTFRSLKRFNNPIGELVGFNQQGQVVATSPLGS